MFNIRGWRRNVMISFTFFAMMAFLIIQDFQKLGQYESALLEISVRESKLQTLKQEKEELSALLKQQTHNLASRVQKETAEKLLADLEHVKENNKTEHIRRKLENDVQELSNFLKAQNLADAKEPKIDSRNSTFQKVSDYFRSLKDGLWSLRQVDEKWRRRQSSELGDLIQKRLHFLQNPRNCSEAKKFLCKLNKACGFACQMHHVMYCLMMSYANQRTLVLLSKGWRYAKGGWDTVFKPVTNCSASTSLGQQVWNKLAKDETKEISLPSIDNLSNKPNYLPPAIPEDLAEDLLSFHGDPRAWWIGQFARYLFRPQADLEKTLHKGALNLTSPIVGIHVRRTDKTSEAVYHQVSEYMKHVDEWFDMIGRRQRVDKRRVFLATDEPNVLKEATQMYPDYEFIYNAENSVRAAHSRYSPDSLSGVIQDVHILSLTDFIVCTFSSQVCRLAYELMQTRHGDASTYYKSLDDIYYFGGQNEFTVRAIEYHYPQTEKEIEIHRNDIIKLHGNLGNGFAKGTNRRTQETGLFPFYKAVVSNVIAKMPTYPDVHLIPY